MGGRTPRQGPHQPRSVPAVMLTGGIVAVAGQFKGWYFAAYAMYPYGEDAQGLSGENPRFRWEAWMGGETSSSSLVWAQIFPSLPQTALFFG